MSFTVGDPQQSGLGVALGGLASGLGQGYSQGLQKQLETFQQQKKLNLQADKLSKYLPREQAIAILSQPKELQKPLLYQSLAEQIMSPQGQNIEINEENEVGTDQSQGSISTLSDEKLTRLLSNPIAKNAADTEIKRREDLRKDVRRSDIKRSDKYLDKINEERDNTLRAKSSLGVIEQALEQKDLGFFSPDNLKSMAGFNRWISPEGAILNTAGKEFFMADIERVTGRPNMFLEKILSNALPQVGKSNEANQTIVEFYKNALDLQEEKQKIADNLEDFYREKIGYVPGNIGRLVDGQLKPYAKQKEKELVDIFKTGKEKYGTSEQKVSDTIILIDPAGNRRRVSKKDTKAALKAGYKRSK